MNRFGSYRLRIVWASIALILVILVLGFIRGFEPESSNLIVLGINIPLGVENPRPYVVQILSRMVYSVVPPIIVFGGFIQLSDWLMASGRAERYMGLLVGSTLAFLHGILLSQLAVLPIFALSYRLLGNPFVISILLANVNAMLLGLQLLLWAAAMGLIIKSNRGLAVFLAYMLNEVGHLMAWCGEFLESLEVNSLIVRFIAFIGKALPSSQLPSDPVVWTTLLLSLGVPMFFAGIVLLFTGGIKRKHS